MVKSLKQIVKKEKLWRITLSILVLEEERETGMKEGKRRRKQVKGKETGMEKGKRRRKQVNEEVIMRESELVSQTTSMTK